MARAKATQSDAPVAAREQLDTLGRENDDPAAGLEEQASEQEKAQAEQLKEGAKAPKDEAQESDVPAIKRTGMVNQAATQNGFMDQMSRRSASDALEGHFVTIDQSADGVEDGYKQAGLVDDDGNLADGAGYYGVYIEPATLDPESGIPVTAVVRLRDATNNRVTVPYDALTPAQAGGR